MKKKLALLLAFTMLLSLVPMNVFGAQPIVLPNPAIIPNINRDGGWYVGLTQTLDELYAQNEISTETRTTRDGSNFVRHINFLASNYGIFGRSTTSQAVVTLTNSRGWLRDGRVLDGTAFAPVGGIAGVDHLLPSGFASEDILFFQHSSVPAAAGSYINVLLLEDTAASGSNEQRGVLVIEVNATDGIPTNLGVSMPIQYISGDRNRAIELQIVQGIGIPRQNIPVANPRTSDFYFHYDGDINPFHTRITLQDPIEIREQISGAFNTYVSTSLQGQGWSFDSWRVQLNLVDRGFAWSRAVIEDVELSNQFGTLGIGAVASPIRRSVNELGRDRNRQFSFDFDLPYMYALTSARFPDVVEIDGLTIVADDNARPGDVRVEVVLSRVLTRPATGGGGAVEHRVEELDYGTITVARFANEGIVLKLHEDEDLDDYWLMSGRREWDWYGGGGIGGNINFNGSFEYPWDAIVPESADPFYHRTARVVLTETVPGSLPFTGLAETVFSFDEGVQVLGVRLETNDAEFVDGDANEYDETHWFIDGREASRAGPMDVLVRRNSVSIRPEIGREERRREIAEIVATFYISVQAQHEALYGEDIAVTVSGRAIGEQFEQSVVCAQAWDPITASTSVSVLDEQVDAAFGRVRFTPINDIVIHETEPGALRRGTQLWVGVEGGVSLAWNASDLISLSATDVRSDNDSGLRVSRPVMDQRGVFVTIERESDDEPGVITFSGAQISGAVVPNWEYDIIVAGDSVADNFGVSEFAWAGPTFGGGRFTRIGHGLFTPEPYPTPAFRFEGADFFAPQGPGVGPQAPIPPAPARTLTLFEGMNHTTSDGEHLQAPLFLLLPNDERPGYHTSYVMMRVVADVLGLQVEWEPSSQSARFYDTRTETEVIFTHNSSTAMVNGTPMEIRASGLRADARIINDRFFVPIGFFRYIFSADVAWNNATRSVTLTAR